MSLTPPIPLRGTHLSLIPLAASHAAQLFATASPALFEHLLQRPHEWSLAGFEALVARLLSQPRVSWVMVLNAPHPHSHPHSHTNPHAHPHPHAYAARVVGHTSYLNIKPEHKTLEIGTTWISQAHHGTAVNPESKLLLMRHAFETLGYNRVEFLVSTRNLRSQRAVAKLGATREGVLRQRWVVPTPPVPYLREPSSMNDDASVNNEATRDVVVFSIICDEWPTVRAGLEARVAGWIAP